MSGSLLGIAASIGGVLLEIINGVGLGGFATFGLETPEKLPFGGRQRVVVHKLLGGNRVVDALGPDEADISFSGYFSGPFAQQRAQMVDAMRQAGAVVPLTWPNDGRMVIVTDFKCTFERSGGLMPYELTCVVIPGYSPQGVPTLTTALGSAASAAISAITGMP